MVPVPFNALGNRSISVYSVDSEGTKSDPKTLNFIGHDCTGPHIDISSPFEDQIFEVPQLPKNIVVSGSITDPQSGVKLDSCRWELTSGTPDTPASSGSLILEPGGAFTIPIEVKEWDTYVLTVEAADNSTNRTIFPRNFALAPIYTPNTIEEVFSPQRYLQALLYFIEHHVIQTEQEQKPLNAAVLTNTFYQPFWKLSYTVSSVGDEPINRLRVPITVLKAYGAARPDNPLPESTSDIIYLQTAYTTLLTKIGTSYDELRLCRGTSEEDSLARRLGIGKDCLKQLLPLKFDEIGSDNGLSEKWLEETFGLAQISYPDPLHTAKGTASLFLKWQKAGSEAQWLAEDNGEKSPLMDPDNVDVNDLWSIDDEDQTSKSLHRMIDQRKQDIQQYENDISSQWPTAGSPKEGFNKALSSALPTLDLKALAAQDDDGQAIDAELQSLHLSRTAFVRLRRLQALADAGSLSVTEPQRRYRDSHPSEKGTSLSDVESGGTSNSGRPVAPILSVGYAAGPAPLAILRQRS